MDSAVYLDSKAMPLFFRVKAGYDSSIEGVHTFAYYLEYLAFHMPKNMVVPALEWLIKNKITGDRFLTFIKFECRSSGLEMIRHLTMRLEREKTQRALTAKDIA